MNTEVQNPKRLNEKMISSHSNNSGAIVIAKIPVNKLAPVKKSVFVEEDTLHGGGAYVDEDTLHGGGAYVDEDTLHSKEEIPSGVSSFFSIEEDILFSGWADIFSSAGKKYRYAFIWRGHYFDIAIQTPRYNGRSEDLRVIHKLPLSENSDMRKICIRNPHIVNNETIAMGILKEYIDLTDVYINTGKTIDEQILERKRHH